MQPDSTHTGSHLTYIVKTQPAAIRFHAVLRPPTFPTQEPARPQGPLDTIQQIGHCRLGIATVIAASPRISRAKQGLTTQITPPGLICHPWTRGVQPTETSKTFSRMRHSIKHCLHRLSGRSSDAIGRRQESSEVLIWMDPARGSRYLFSIPYYTLAPKTFAEETEFAPAPCALECVLGVCRPEIGAGPQKGAMILPGPSFIAVNERGWQRAQAGNLPRYYVDCLKAREALENGDTPFTSAQSLIAGLPESLGLLLDRGMEHYWEKYTKLARSTPAGAKAIGLDLLAKHLSEFGNRDQGLARNRRPTIDRSHAQRIRGDGGRRAGAFAGENLPGRAYGVL